MSSKAVHSMQGSIMHRAHQAVMGIWCGGVALALLAISEADLELRHVFLGEDIKGILCSLQGRQGLVQAGLALRSNGICLLCLFPNLDGLSVHLQSVHT